MSSPIALVLCLLVAVTVAIPATGYGAPGAVGAPAIGPVNPWIPPWVAQFPWMPQWSPCTTVGSSCLNCNTKLICTKVGGLQRACTDPTLPYCNLGECSATPTAECTPEAAPQEPIIPAVPA